MEAKPEEEEEEGEEGFMADRRVVEREMDQDGEVGNGVLKCIFVNIPVFREMVETSG